MTYTPKTEEIDRLYEKLRTEAAAGGYNLNPDEEFTRDLVESLLVNTHRYGYQACPCRLAEGEREKDLDILCPCDYRDPDLDEFGACYCALYVSDEIASGEKEVEPIPERRPAKEMRDRSRERAKGRRGGENDPVSPTHPITQSPIAHLPYPVWRCPVCGYLCARVHPPEKCPVCKADKDRFEPFP